MGTPASLDFSNKYGNAGFIIEIMGELMEDQYGLSTCTMTGKIAYGPASFNSIPGLFSFHPFFNGLAIERRRITTKDGFYHANLEYVGLAGNVTQPIYELCLGVGQEPIVVHPKFATQIGGRASAPLNGAIFIDISTGKRTTSDAVGVFSHFSTMYNGNQNPFAGVEDFIDFSQAVWRMRQYTTFQPGDISLVGKISFPEGPVPGLGGTGRNWIMQSINFERRGNIFSVTKEWKASAPQGWNHIIYTN